MEELLGKTLFSRRRKFDACSREFSELGKGVTECFREFLSDLISIGPLIDILLSAIIFFSSFFVSS